jgi:hypothetical protein
MGGGTGKPVETADKQGTEQGNSAHSNSPGTPIRGKSGGIQDDYALNAFRLVAKGPETDCPAPVVDDEAHLVDAQLIKKLTQVLDVRGQVIRRIGMRRLVRQAAAKVIGGDASGLFPHGEDQLAIKERPSGISVKHENGSPLPFSLVQIMQAMPMGKHHEVSLEGILLSDFRG